mmetsp:Transcript_13673/g.25723  ORF Transcript_13673/g.25723 Transcript_13673/m.25723 type:complete len:403 (+) Transcript_13673:82-1290(+)|eukprot:CAMPEP_0176505694 /NCGR_PEP_ID=MMETSP0200_2-20121128/16637_1 /TAXON_ID=947934 /ORGANISM="Chaetoceros sp., Strain GSL56" /LENGTH=402 /DNA_ID=CAMNT_0017905277 /DNA_START=74 /DNA_END=1282 /DNA_ORIENTATION=-
MLSSKYHTCLHILLITFLSCQAKRFQFQGPIVTLTLRDPNEATLGGSSTTGASAGAGISSGIRPNPANRHTKDANDSQQNGESNDPNNLSQLQSPKYWWKRFQPHKQMTPLQNVLNLPSLSPTVLWGIRSLNPLPNYFPLLQSTSLTASYNYHDVRDKPNYIEGDMRFYSDKLKLDMDIGASYSIPQETTALSLRFGGGGGGGGGSFSDSESSALLQIVIQKGKQYLNFIRGQYTWNLPPSFQSALSSLSITPTYNFPQKEAAVVLVGKSTLGRTAAVLDLNWSRPVLKVIHALDERNTIQPEICLYDAKIMYHWSVRLNDDGSSLKMMVDPTEAVQISWIDQARNGKWVTDFRLPLMSGSVVASGVGGGKRGVGGSIGRNENVGVAGILQGDIRVRRQFIF